jgi:hypothetical protein
MTTKKPASHTQYRNNDSGRFVPDRVGENSPRTTTRERVPNPGHGDTGRYDKPKR